MNNFQYTVLPSASQIGELPLYLAYKALKSDNISRAVAGYLVGFIALPISVAFTPLTILADVITGIAEAIFIAYKGADRKEIQELLVKKIIVCSLQQILSATIKTVLFIPFSLMWTLSYAGGQGVIKTLPESLNHKRMNIFINGGITDKGSDKTWFDEETELTLPSSSHDDAYEAGSKLKARIAEVIASVSRINKAQTSQNYFQFKQKILNQETAQNIFGFIEGKFTRSDLLKRYRELLLIVHPDKNLDSQHEAHLLFLCLQEAFIELDRFK